MTDSTAREQPTEVGTATVPVHVGPTGMNADPTVHEPESAAEAGVVDNLEVLAAPQPPPVVVSPLPLPPLPDGSAAAPSSPWARPTSFTPQPSWDLSGYAPPPAIRIEEHAAAGMTAITTYAGLYPLPAPAPEAAPAPPRPVTSVQQRPSRWARVQLRTSLTILLFISGLAIGVVGLRLATPVHTDVPDGIPTLHRTSVEPLPASAVAQELAKNDVHGLAQLLDSDSLTAIQTQLKPFVTFESVTFVGATTDDRDIIAGYVVRGRDQDGNLGLVGLTIRLRDGQVVAQ